MTISSFFVRRMLTGVASKGYSVSDCLCAAGLPSDLLEQPRACVTAQQYSAFLSSLAERFRDEAFCSLSRPFKPGSFGLMLRSAVTGRTLDEAIRRAAHTFHILQDDVILESCTEGPLAGVKLNFVNMHTASNEFLHELLLRVFWRSFAWLIGGRLSIARFDFAFSDPGHSNEYVHVFPTSRRYDQAFTCMWFDAARRNALVCRDSDATRAFLAKAYEEVIVPTRDAGISGRVRRYLQTKQPQWPDLAEAASALNMATSTLQRRLMTEGRTSFQALKDQLRRDVALFRMRTSDIPCSALADELGFSDSATFQRAFRRWTGIPPGTYQNQLRERSSQG